MTNKDLSIIIPAYKEYECLKKILPELELNLKKIKLSFELIIIDSIQFSKETSNLCRKYKALYFNRSFDDSYGSAIKTGVANSVGDLVIIMDSDGSHNAGFIRTLLKHLDDNDVVIASRYINGGYTDNNLFQVFLSKIVNIIFSKLLGLNISDVSNSFRIYKGALLRGLHLECKHFDIQEEILVKIIWENSAKILEIPYSFERRLYGRSKRSLVIFIIHYFFSLVKFLFLKIKNGY